MFGRLVFGRAGRPARSLTGGATGTPPNGTPIDWTAAGYDDADMHELVELMLRTLQSFIVGPGNPPRSPAEIRAYLNRWIAPAVNVERQTR